MSETETVPRPYRNDKGQEVFEDVVFELTAMELRHHLAERAKYHRARFEKLEKKGVLLQTDQDPEDDDDPDGVSNYKMSSNVRAAASDLQSKAWSAKQRAESFDWAAKHVPEGAVYRLTIHELTQLEIWRG